jgi:hypothetical protein
VSNVNAQFHASTLTLDPKAHHVFTKMANHKPAGAPPPDNPSAAAAHCQHVCDFGTQTTEAHVPAGFLHPAPVGAGQRRGSQEDAIWLFADRCWD